MAIKDKMNADYFYGQNFSHNLKLSLPYYVKQQRDKKYRLTIRRFSHNKNAVSNLVQLLVATLQKWRPFFIKHPRINFDLNLQFMAALHETD